MNKIIRHSAPRCYKCMVDDFYFLNASTEPSIVSEKRTYSALELPGRQVYFITSLYATYNGYINFRHISDVLQVADGQLFLYTCTGPGMKIVIIKVVWHVTTAWRRTMFIFMPVHKWT